MLSLKTVFATPVSGMFLVSPNMNSLPSTPLDQIPYEFSEFPFPSETKTIRLSHNQYPFLGFVVANVRWEGTLLERLHLPPRIPLEQDNGQWRFNKDLARRWNRLEMGLKGIPQALGDHFELLFPSEIGAFRGPESHGYMKSRSTAKAMVTAILRSRDAFLPLMAYCSYVIALSPKVHATPYPPWMRHLVDIGIDPQWVQYLKHSPVGSFSEEYKRVGVVVHQLCHFPEQIPAFVEAGVPVWIYFNGTPTPNKLCYSGTIVRKLYLPTPSEYRQATTAYHNMPDKAPHSPSPIPCPVLPGLASAEAGPHRDGSEPHAQSGQRRGETWPEFFARQEQNQKAREAKETPHEREQRLQHAEAQNNHPLPGRKGPICFVWEEEDGFWMRRRVARLEANDRFLEHAKTQRRYNAFNKEWDLCEDFDPKADPPEDHYCPNFPADDEEQEPAPASSPPAPGQAIPRAMYGEDLIAEQNRPDYDFYITFDKMDQMLIFRHGFALVGDGRPFEPKLWEEKGMRDWSQVCQTLSDVIRPWTGPPQDIVRDFVARITCRQDFPAHQCDLSRQHPARIMPETNSMSVQRRTSGNDTNPYYVINPSNIQETGEAKPLWQLVVRDPTTALECVRRFGGTGRKDIAKHFALTGRAFATRLLMHNPPPSNVDTGRRVGMGWRERVWRPSPHDYSGYWFNLRNWMTTPRRRAALMSGGIAWRLCLEVLCHDDIELVLLGPDYKGYGQRVRFDGDELQSWDNELTGDDFDVISGVYRQFTGTRSHKRFLVKCY